MSRIGRSPIQIPSGVTVSAKGRIISVKGPKGVLTQKIDPSIDVKIEGNVINLSRKSEIKKHKAMHGLYRSLLANMIKGVHTGFEKNLEINGVGYRVVKEGKKLVLSMGFSHPVSIEPPAGIDFVLEGQTKVKVVGADKQLVGQIASDIKYVRPVEPYKGKGIRYAGQYVRRKAGKAAAKAAS